jgi:hypothetical protein
MKTVNFKNAFLMIYASVPFCNSFFSCDAKVQICFCDRDNFDLDVVEYNNCMNLVTNQPITIENARAAFLAFGIEMDEVIDNAVSAHLTKTEIASLVSLAIAKILKK